MNCPVCRVSPAEIGVLCEDCRDELVGISAVASEQIMFRDHVEATNAALVDAWGRPYRLGAQTMIGREANGHGIQILEPSVSRQHARLVVEAGQWSVVDLRSTNGTVVDDVDVSTVPHPLHHGARIRFGSNGFYFLSESAGLPPRRHDRAGSETRRPPSLGPASSNTAEIAAPTWQGVSIVLNEPTGGGGCVAEIDGKRVQLTIAQQELISILLDRIIAEADLEESDRGFVAMSELVARISLDSAEANVRQLVLRVRRTLQRAGIPDLIESRHGRGYRLRVKPRS